VTRTSGLSTFQVGTAFLVVPFAAAPVVVAGLSALAGPAIPDQSPAILADLLFAIALFVRHLILSFGSQWIERSPHREERIYERKHRVSGRLLVSPRWLTVRSAQARSPEELVPSIQGPDGKSDTGGNVGDEDKNLPEATAWNWGSRLLGRKH
jgi:hypothetical protein